MLLGYNTNGLAHHRLTDAIVLLAEEGFQSVAVTLDAGALDPYQEPSLLARQLAEVRDHLDRADMRRVVETGARYLLNPRLKHNPTLMDPDPARRAVRIDFLRRSIDIARELGASCISLWSGTIRDSIPEALALERLVEALRPVLEHAETVGIPLAFEPEPGMFIDTLARFRQLDERIAHRLFQMTMDLGHVHCIEDGRVEDHLLSWSDRILNIHIEDMVRGVHDHLMFGAGTMEFGPIFAALRRCSYRHGLHVELSRHSHMAPEAVRQSRSFLQPFLNDGSPPSPALGS
jgi:sugar phosphate isomerase/epimerase